MSSARWLSGVCSTRTRQPSSRHRITCCICSTRRSSRIVSIQQRSCSSVEPMALAEGIASEPGAGLPAIAASSTGTIVYRTGSAGGQRQFVWFDRAGKELSRIGTPETHGPSYGSISPTVDAWRCSGPSTGTRISGFWTSRGDHRSASRPTHCRISPRHGRLEATGSSRLAT